MVPLKVANSSCAVQALRIIQLQRVQYSIAIRGDLIVGVSCMATEGDRLAVIIAPARSGSAQCIVATRDPASRP